MEQRILLGTAEAVNLVDEQDGAAVERHEPALGLIDLTAKILDRTSDRRNLDELAARMRCDDMRERGLTRAGRPVENHAGKHIMLNGGTKP